MIHCRFRNPSRFEGCVRIVSEGGRFEALRSHPREQFKARFLRSDALPRYRQVGERDTMMATILQEGSDRTGAHGLGNSGGL